MKPSSNQAPATAEHETRNPICFMIFLSVLYRKMPRHRLKEFTAVQPSRPKEKPAPPRPPQRWYSHGFESCLPPAAHIPPPKLSPQESPAAVPLRTRACLESSILSWSASIRQAGPRKKDPPRQHKKVSPAETHPAPPAPRESARQDIRHPRRGPPSPNPYPKAACTPDSCFPGGSKM